MKLDNLLIPHTRINSKWIKDFNVRHEAIKIIEEKHRQQNLGHWSSSIFSDISLQAMETKEKINK